VSAVFIQVKNRARGNVTAPMIIWAILMAVVIFMVEASHGAHHDALWVGFGATALFGVYLGLRRRVAACFVAPSSVGWSPGYPCGLPRWCETDSSKDWPSAFSGDDRLGHHRRLEFATLFIVGSFIRLLRGSSGSRDPGVTVYGPGGDER